MAQSAFTLLTNQLIDNSIVNGNGLFTLWTSPSQNNSVGLPCLRLVTEYKEITPAAFFTCGLNVVVEAQAGSQWYVVAYQFERFHGVGDGDQRVIVLQPDISTFNDGIDSIVYVAGATMSRISRQQGRVGGTFRVRLLYQENAYGQPDRFQSGRFNVYGELYD